MVKITNKRAILTPEMARGLLADNIHNNRHVSFAHVRKLAHAISSGHFAFNGESIKISESGHMIDGQHRCLACIEADKPIDVMIVSGIPDDAFETLDQGKARQASDFLDSGRRHAILGGARLLFAYDYYQRSGGEFRGIPLGPQDTPDNSELLEYTHGKPKYIARCEALEPLSRVARFIPPSVAMFCNHLFCEIDEDDAAIFFSALADGEGLTASDGIYHLRERMIAARINPQMKLQRPAQIAATFIAWNLLRSGRKISTFRALTWRGSGPSARSFPRLN